MKIKTGDNVMVTTGKDKGKTGKVMQVFPLLDKVIVEGLNKATKHLRGRGKKQPGKKIEYSAPIHLSNVALVDAKGVKGRVGYEQLGDKKKKQRVLRKGGETKSL